MIDQFQFLSFTISVFSMGVFGLFWGLTRHAAARARAERQAELDAKLAAAASTPYVCSRCREWWLPWWTDDCSHAKRDSIMVQEADWKGIDAWLEKWRGKKWNA